MKIHTVELPLGESGRHEVVLLADHGQALAKMLAERDTAIAQMQNIRKQRDAINKELGDTEFNLCIAQQQLAEAVELLKYVKDWFGYGDLPESLNKLDAFLARHAQAEQQEAQGAQAGDERAAFEEWASDVGLYPKAVERRGDQYKLAQTHSYWQAWQARAALATQPVVLPTDPASWPLKVGADEFVGQQEKWPDTDPSDFMHDALYEMIRVLTKPAVRGAEHGQ